MSTYRHLSTLVLLLSGFFLFQCDQEEIPLYQPNAEVRTKTISLYFQDRSDDTPNIGIYINNQLLRTNGASHGLLQFAIPDSLQNRTFTIALGEYSSSDAPAALNLDGIVFETLLFPDELLTLSSILMTRENELTPVEVIKLKIPEDEAAPRPGYFKVKFYSVAGDPVTLKTRDGEPVAGYESLKGFEERGFIELPFGSYRFSAIRDDGSSVGLFQQPPLMQAAAGKVYFVMLSKETQQITEVKDFGTPSTYANLGFMNLVPGSEATLHPLSGADRAAAEPRGYAKYAGVEMVPAGKVSVRVTAGGKEIVKETEVMPWEQMMAYLVEKDGQPEIQFVNSPLYENIYGYGVYTRYLNFSPDAGTVSFGRLLPSGDPNFGENPVIIINSLYASNLSFGEVVVSNNAVGPKSVYAGYDISSAPLHIQAYKAIDSPLGLGEPLADTRLPFPFFYERPTIALEDYQGSQTAQAGTYTVILAGRAAPGVPLDQKLKTIVIRHSY
jgi:hypothetical protein